MKNPVTQLWHCCRWWLQLQKDGFFTPSDAMLQIGRVILPSRFAYRRAGRRLQQVADIQPLGEDLHRIRLLEHPLHFYWSGRIDNNLYFLIAVKFFYSKFDINSICISFCFICNINTCYRYSWFKIFYTVSNIR